ncbi:hypothetical protein BH10PSE7_BH10PSE7_14260 [soil metagenome]
MNRKTQSPKTLRRDAKALVETCIALNVRLAARRISQYLDQALADCGLTIGQIGLLAQIAAASDDRLGALASSMGLEQSTLSRNLKVLERDGLIEIAVVEKDLRRRAVWLTETGARRLEAAIPAWRKADENLARHISRDMALRLALQTGRPSSRPSMKKPAKIQRRSA